GEHKPVLCNTKEKQTVIIVNKNRHLNIPEFWIDQLKDPDKVIMDAKAIKAFNEHTSYTQHRLTFFKDVASAYGTSWVKESIERAGIGLRNSTKYFSDGNKIKNSFFDQVQSYMSLELLQESKVTTRYALTVNYSDQKIIPTELALLKKKNQIHFDRNQNSALDIATPVAILHTTEDGQWHYGIGPTSSGWLKDSDIAFGSKKEIQNYLDSKNYIVTTSAKSALMIAGSYHDYLRMGVRLPVIMTIDEMSMVLIPTRDREGNLVLGNGTIKTSDTHKGYLAYTPRNILLQAFKFLNAPYGWGGMYGEQDCSKFLQEIYATTGVMLPRNSASQSEVGTSQVVLEGLANNLKKDILNKSDIGSTILHLPGHIVLYLGEYKGEPYIIHTVWGSSSKHFALGRTAVTPLRFNNYISQVDMATNITP
nr:SH3 domain-containing protein [Campylobacterota bacterium]